MKVFPPPYNFLFLWNPDSLYVSHFVNTFWKKVKVKSVSHLWPCGLACQAPLSLGFSRQEYWSWLPFSSGDLPDPGIEPRSPTFAGKLFYHLSHQRIPIWWVLVSSFREGNGNPLQYSCLANPMDGGVWWTAVHGVSKSRTRLSDFTFTFHFHALEKEMATHSNILAWRIPGTEEPGGLPSIGSHRVGHDWSDLAVAAVATVSSLTHE